MKTKEELNTMKSEVEALAEKLQELSEEELEHVIGGAESNQDMAGFGSMKGNNCGSNGSNGSVEKLSTGCKINSSKDNSSGYQIADC